jgi:hypothetical protein
MRVKLEKIVITLAMGAALGLGGCGSSSNQPYGDVIMTVTVPEGAQVQSVSYMMADKVDAPSQGVVGGMQPAQEFVELIPHVPANSYVVTVQAETTDGQMSCGGSANVVVMSGVTTRVEIDLKCGGQVLVGIGVTCDASPLVAFVVSPIVATVGNYVIGYAGMPIPDGGTSNADSGTTSVDGGTTSADVGTTSSDGGTTNAVSALTYKWSAPSGTFADPTASLTTFTCTQPGAVTVTLKVESVDQCQQTFTSLVTCVSAPEPGPDAAVDGGAGDGGSSDAHADGASDASADSSSGG